MSRKEDTARASRGYSKKQAFVETTLANTLSEALGEPVIMTYIWQNHEEIVEIKAVDQSRETYPLHVDVTADSLVAIASDVFKSLL